MKDIVDIKYINEHQDEILELGDVVPKCIMRYIPLYKIEEYFEINQKNNQFQEDFKTIEEWIESEKLVLDYDFPEDIIELLEDWVECYPQFEGVLKKENFEEFIENDGVINQSEELDKIEKRFHDLTMQRAGNLIEKFDIEMPHINEDLLKNTDEFSRESFPVPGMYGGFYYYLTIVNGEFLLDVDSWSRVVGGSGQNHEITVDECKLVSEGFV